jgi:hypothetical protein
VGHVLLLHKSDPLLPRCRAPQAEAEAARKRAEAERRRLEVEAEAERRRLEVEAEAERRRLEVEAEAERRRLEAEAEAERRRLEAEAEAERRRLEVEADAARRREEESLNRAQGRWAGRKGRPLPTKEELAVLAETARLEGQGRVPHAVRAISALEHSESLRMEALVKRAILLSALGSVPPHRLARRSPHSP